MFLSTLKTKVGKMIFMIIFIVVCGMSSFAGAMDLTTTNTVIVNVTPIKIVKAEELSILRSSFGENNNDPNKLFIYLEKISGTRNGSECISEEQLKVDLSKDFPLPMIWFEDKKCGDKVTFKERGVNTTVICGYKFKELLEASITKYRFKEVLEALKIVE